MHFSRFFPLISALALCGSPASAQQDTSAADLNVAETIELLASSGDPVVQVSAGGEHACALVQSGKVYCWGSNSRGQLGNGTNDDSAVPVQVKRLTNIQQIAVAVFHTCALQNGGRVFCWGGNFAGQLGNGTFDDKSIRVRVRNSTDAIHISAGIGHTCMIKSNGQAYCWGDNTFGELGTGEGEGLFPTPKRVAGSQRFEDLSTTGPHTCALTRGGRAYCWGLNDRGQLGRENPSDISRTPKRVSGSTRFTQVTAGFFHSCALREDGVPFCWGEGAFGALGTGNLDISRVPTRVKRLFDAKTIEAGGNHTCALRENKKVVCWGNNRFGQLGDGTTTDRRLRRNVKSLNSVADLTAGRELTCAAKENGQAFCWGSNSGGQLGNGEENLDPNPVRSRLTRLGS